MVHVYWIEQGVEDNHGRPFEAEMRRINGMGEGITVTKTEMWDDPEVQAKSKQYAVYIAMADGVAEGFLMGASNVTQKVLDFFHRFDKTREILRKSPRTLEVFLYDAPWLNRYRGFKTSAKSLAMYRVTPTQLKEIREQGIYKGLISNGVLKAGKNPYV